MKPKIDLNNPLVIAAIKRAQNQVLIALNAPPKVESAVIPIYATLKRKGHQKPKTKPEQIGSGVVVNIKNQFFVFGATHVFEEFTGFALRAGPSPGKSLIQEIPGERFSTGELDRPLQNIFDATVYHIQSDSIQPFKDIAITLDDFDFSNGDDVCPVYMASGFRIKKSNTAGDLVTSKQECFPSFELKNEDYLRLKINPESHFSLSYEDQVLLNGKWTQSPRPRGLSGGAIIKVDGTDVLNPKNTRQNPRQLLTAITTDHVRDKGGELGYLLGTRVNVYLGLIHKFLPDLLLPELLNNKGSAE